MASNHDRQRLAPPWIPPATGRANRSRRVITVDRRRPLLTPASPNVSTEFWWAPWDATTITNSSGVAELRDRKNNGRNLQNATPANRPTIGAGLNGKSGLNFNGSQWLTSVNAASVFNFFHQTAGAGSAIVAVWRVGAAGNSNPGIVAGLIGNNNGTTANTGFYLLYDDRVSVPRNDRVLALTSRGVSGTQAALNQTGDGAHPAGVPVIISWISDPGNPVAANRSILRINGTEIRNNVDTTAPSAANAFSPLQLGAVGGNLIPLIGDVWEVIGLPPGSTLNRVIEMEGYLAGPVAGFNLQSNLALGHPWRTSAPTL